VITSWGRHVHVSSEAHLDHLVDERDQQHELPVPTPLLRIEDGVGPPAEAEDDRALVLAQDPDEEKKM